MQDHAGKKIILEIKEDGALIAGLIIKVGDRLFEHSVRLALRQLSATLQWAQHPPTNGPTILSTGGK